ncbi:MAG: hypothetical protein IPL61_29740 [Myxococcales bacterium]|nr:hypothetical protein [Myxococcales bacterium]
MPKETPPAPGRTAMIVAVASLTLAVGATVAALTGWIGRRPPAAAAPEPPSAAAPDSVDATVGGPTSTPDTPPGPLSPQPTILVPVQPVNAAAEPALAPSPDDLVAADWRGDDGGRKHRRHHEDDDDDDDREHDDD